MNNVTDILNKSDLGRTCGILARKLHEMTPTQRKINHVMVFFRNYHFYEDRLQVTIHFLGSVLGGGDFDTTYTEMEKLVEFCDKMMLDEESVRPKLQNFMKIKYGGAYLQVIFLLLNIVDEYKRTLRIQKDS